MIYSPTKNVEEYPFPSSNLFNHLNFWVEGRDISLFKLYFHKGTALHVFIGHLSFINEKTEVK